MKLLLIDGSSMIATLYYATLPNSVKYEKDENKKKEHYKDIMQANGKYTNAIFSMMKKILKIIEKQDVTHIAVAFDKSRNTFRKEIYSQYKANRKTTEEPLAQQFKNIMEYLNRMGIQVFASSMFEADDIIGSLCEKFKSEIQISVLTKDKDYLQLADKNVTIWLEQKNQIAADELFSEYNMFKGDYNVPEKVFPFNEELIYQYFNILPKQVADWKAITGDTSDNIPGVKGVASASTILLSLHDTVENIFEYVKQNKKEDVIKYWKENGIKRAPYNAFISEQNYETAKMSKILATIVKDLMFDISLDDLKININEEELKKIKKELNITSF